MKCQARIPCLSHGLEIFELAGVPSNTVSSTLVFFFGKTAPKYYSLNDAHYFFFRIGRGVFATCTYSRGDLLLVYAGELLSGEEGDRREDGPKESVFRFFFNHDKKDGSKLCFNCFKVRALSDDI